jgi:hypothetical protein
MSKISITGVTFIALGIISGFIQNTYYGYIDADGVLHDSLWLPLAFLFAGIGLFLLLIQALRKILTKKRV